MDFELYKKHLAVKYIRFLINANQLGAVLSGGVIGQIPL
jgi:hypothetical protein